jgi:hypothetical protein
MCSLVSMARLTLRANSSRAISVRDTTSRRFGGIAFSQTLDCAWVSGVEQLNPSSKQRSVTVFIPTIFIPTSDTVSTPAEPASSVCGQSRFFLARCAMIYGTARRPGAQQCWTAHGSCIAPVALAQRQTRFGTSSARLCPGNPGRSNMTGWDAKRLECERFSAAILRGRPGSSLRRSSESGAEARALQTLARPPEFPCPARMSWSFAVRVIGDPRATRP